MVGTLNGMRIAVVCTDGVEQAELTEPAAALRAAGATVVVISPREHWVSGVPDKLRALDTLNWADTFDVDLALEDAQPEDFDALYLPGGIINPDLLRLHPKTKTFVRAFFDAGKPVASMCHGPWNLIEADVVRGRTLTSWPSLRKDIENAGGTWVDQPVVVDGLLVTSRNPGDIAEHLNPALIQVFAQHRSRQTA